MVSTIDSAAASVLAMQEAAMMNQIMFAVAKKASDATKVQGDAIVQMLESAAQLGKALGSGNNFDAIA